MVTQPVILVLSGSALPLARRIKAHLEDAEIHGLAGRVEDCDVAFADAAAHLRQVHGEGRAIIGVCAAAILIRALAPALADKRADPPVLAVSQDGQHVLPLLGGHHGANALARDIAEATGGVAAATTASDAIFGVALDDPPTGWTLANPEDFKDFAAALLAGESVRLNGEAEWISAAGLPLAPDGVLAITVTEKRMDGGPRHLIYHPAILAIGAGCERGCEVAELIALCERVLLEHGLASEAVALVASLDIKADEQAIDALAARLGAPLRLFDKDQLNAEAHRLANPSDVVLREVGVPGVAEAAALAAAGPDAALAVEKIKSRRATIAIARAAGVIDPARIGRARGRLAVIGLGPGAPDWRSGETERLLRAASDWIGYGAYLDMAAELSGGKTLHPYGLGEEEARVRHALELAGEGRSVALICSGDPGIYALATLVFELTDPAAGARMVSDEARRAEIVVAPGISALQAAAARAGAPLGHDFCAISLSDLMTPWPVIEQRVAAAAEGDFVVAFYNPRSRRRQSQLSRAIAMLRAMRPARTPVLLAREVGRPDETVVVTDLASFDPETVDMRTLVIVGSCKTRTFTTSGGVEWVYTPRGYDQKQARQPVTESAS